MRALVKRIDKLEKVSCATEVVVIVRRDGEPLGEVKARWATVHPGRDLDQADLLIVVELVEPADARSTATRRPTYT
mgnify:CR=1 FL=1